MNLDGEDASWWIDIVSWVRFLVTAQFMSGMGLSCANDVAVSRKSGSYLNFQFRFCFDCLSWYSSTGLLSCFNAGTLTKARRLMANSLKLIFLVKKLFPS